MVHPSIRTAAPVVLVAAVLLTTVELLRATSPLLDLAAAGIGVVGAAQLAMMIFAAPVLIGALIAAVGTARTTLALVVALVLLRLLAQALDPATLLVTGAGAACGIGALVLVVRRVAVEASAVAATVGVLVGTVVDLALRAGYGSWDPVFRSGPVPWLVPVLAGAAMLTAVAASPTLRPRLPWRSAPAAPTEDTESAPLDAMGAGRAGALGPYLGLYVLGYGSAPILAAHAGVSLPVASLVLIATAVVAMELLRRMKLPGGSGAVPEPDRWFAGLLALLGLGAGIAVGYWFAGPVVLPAFAVAGLSAAVLLARALTPVAERRPRRPAVGFAAAGLAAGLGYVLPVMLYQVHFDLEFPVDNRLVLVGFAVLLGVAGLGVRPPAAPADRRGLLARPATVSTVAAAALLVPLVLVVVRPAVAEPTQTGATVRLMSWNVMYSRHHTRGEVDLGGLIDTVDAVDPDILVLQEVSRGWPISGGVDTLEHLSRRLGMPYHWSPAADGMFGNALLTRLPVSDVERGRLPFLQGPMHRSYLAATVELDSGAEFRVINAHLQHRKENSPTRLLQSEALHELWGGAPRTVIAGDFNFWPSWQEARLWESAGFQSAQDVTGHGAEFTVPSDNPDNRVDWIFGTPDLTFSNFDILTSATNSDHFPLVVTVDLG